MLGMGGMMGWRERKAGRRVVWKRTDSMCLACKYNSDSACSQMMMMMQSFMSSDVGWHIRDKLWTLFIGQVNAVYLQWPLLFQVCASWHTGSIRTGLGLCHAHPAELGYAVMLSFPFFFCLNFHFGPELAEILPNSNCFLDMALKFIHAYQCFLPCPPPPTPTPSIPRLHAYAVPLSPPPSPSFI